MEILATQALMMEAVAVVLEVVLQVVLVEPMEEIIKMVEEEVEAV